jgi:hypothetical protein
MKFLIPLLILSFTFHAIIELAFYSLPESLYFLSLQNYWVELESYDWLIALIDITLGGLLFFPGYKVYGNKFSLFLEVLFRVGLGSMFIAAAWVKIIEPGQFSLLIAQYQLLPEFMVNIFALFLPMLELLVGLLLLFSKHTQANAKLLFVMFIVFIIALTQALVRDLGITCGCFEMDGANDKKGAWISLARDILLLYPTLFLWVKGSKTNVLVLTKQFLFQK